MYGRLACYTAAIAMLSLLGCSEPSAPADTDVIFLNAAGPTTIAAVVGDIVTPSPSVVIKDLNGTPVADVPVTFSVTLGGGAIVGATVKTTSSGVATLLRWTLGGRPGTNQVAARALSQTITFTATTVAGPPRVIQKVDGDDQLSGPGTAVPVRPSVRVSDAYNNSLAGIVVTFAVSSGQGTVSTADVVTDSSGRATVGGWWLGTSAEQTLNASIPTLSPVVFKATVGLAFANCAPSGKLTINATIESTLTQQSCQGIDGRFVETFTVQMDSGAVHEVTLASPDFATYLELRDNRGNPVGSSNDFGKSATHSRIKALIRSGPYTVVVSSAKPASIGRYSIGYTQLSSDVGGCEPTDVVRGIVTAHQFINTNDCVVTPERSEDRYQIWLLSGSALAISLEDWSYSDQHFEITDAAGTVLGISAASGAYTYTLSLTAPATGYYTIRVLGGSYEWGIEYVLSILQ